MTEARTVDEAYSSATHSSSLRVQADKRGDADVIIAAGWSPSRIGSALLRLHSEWDGASKPRKMTTESIEAYSFTLEWTPEERIPKEKWTPQAKLSKARKIANGWYSQELSTLVGKLKTAPVVNYQITLQAYKWDIKQPEDVVPAVVLWWLAPTCTVCNGQQNEVIPNTPSLSSAVCEHCHGSGLEHLPFGESGRRVSQFISDCLSNARSSIGRRLRMT